MRKKLLCLMVCLLVVSLLGASSGWASPGNKDFLPPGLSKKDKPLPPPFQNVEKSNLTSSIEGEVVLAKEIAGEKWLVIEGLKELKAVKISGGQKYYVGDIVLVNYVEDKASSIKIVRTNTENKGNLRYIFTTSKAEANVGDNIVFNLHVQNPTSNTIMREFRSSQRYDYIVKRNGVKVWQWSDQWNFLTVIQNDSISGNDSVTYTASWKPDRIGEYTVEAYYLGESTSKPVSVKNINVSRDIANTQLSYSLSVHPTTIVLGREVNMNLTVKNDTRADIIKQFSSGQIYDYIIRQDGRKVWQWSENYDYIATGMQINFKPGDSITLAASWEPNSSGKYTVEAYFLGESSRPVALGEFTVNRR